jgi:hypothetical protein
MQHARTCIGAIQHDDWLSSFGGSDGEVVKIEANSNLTLTLHTKSHARLKVMNRLMSSCKEC